MNDCSKVEYRDRLPDLLHGQLSEMERAVVAQHVDECEDCRVELELLRTMRGAILGATPAIDYAAIVDRLPQGGGAFALPPVARTARRWSPWYVAAAASIIAAAGLGTSFLMRGTTPTERVPVTVATTVAPATVTATSPSPVTPAAVGAQTQDARTPVATAPVTRVASAEHELAVQGDLSDLSESDLRHLLDDVDGIDAVPAAEPDIDAAAVTLTGGN